MIIVIFSNNGVKTATALPLPCYGMVSNTILSAIVRQSPYGKSLSNILKNRIKVIITVKKYLKQPELQRYFIL